MKPETKRRLKLWLRKRALMALRAVVWAVDDWLHRQEVRLREDLAEAVRVRLGSARPARAQGASVPSLVPIKKNEFVRDRVFRRSASGGEPQCTAPAKKRGVSAAEFDRKILKMRGVL